MTPEEEVVAIAMKALESTPRYKNWKAKGLTYEPVAVKRMTPEHAATRLKAIPNTKSPDQYELWYVKMNFPIGPTDQGIAFYVDRKSRTVLLIDEDQS